MIDHPDGILEISTKNGIDISIAEVSIASSYSIHPNQKGAEIYAKCVQAKIDELDGQKNQTPNENRIPTTQEETTAKVERPTTQPTTAQPTTQEQNDIFSQIPGEMIYTSGAGAWACTLNMNSDGSFTGTYIDDDMGDKGDEYPNGTRYYSTFSGKFTVVEKVDDYTYSVKLENLQLDNEPDSVEYKDGRKFVYTDAVGLSGATGFYICVPGKSMSEIPNDVKLLSERLNAYTADTLSDYLLYGTTDNGYSAAFVSYAS